MERTRVPEPTVDEHSDPSLREGDVYGPPRPAWDGIVDLETVSAAVELPPQLNFGRRIASPLRPHPVAYGPGRRLLQLIATHPGYVSMFFELRRQGCAAPRAEI